MVEAVSELMLPEALLPSLAIDVESGFSCMAFISSNRLRDLLRVNFCGGDCCCFCFCFCCCCASFASAAARMLLEDLRRRSRPRLDSSLETLATAESNDVWVRNTGSRLSLVARLPLLPLTAKDFWFWGDDVGFFLPLRLLVGRTNVGSLALVAPVRLESNDFLRCVVFLGSAVLPLF